MTRRRKQNIKLALVCAILGAIVLMTIFAPWLAPYDPLEVNMEMRPARKVVDRSLTAYTGPWAVSKHTDRC